MSLNSHVQQWLRSTLSNSPNGSLGLPQKRLYTLVKYLAQAIFGIRIQRPCHIAHIIFLFKLFLLRRKPNNNNHLSRKKRKFKCPSSQRRYIYAILLALYASNYIQTTNLTMRLTAAGRAIC